MLPSTTPWHEAWWDLPSSSLRLSLSLRKPENVAPLIYAWMTEFADANRAFLVEDGPDPHATYLRLGCAELGNGEWLADATEANRDRLVASYASYAGGVCAWDFGDPKTTADGALGSGHASLQTDDPDLATGTARGIIIDSSGAGVPQPMESAWTGFLFGLVRDFDVLHAEISPGLKGIGDDGTMTNYEVRTGRRPTYRVQFLEVEERLRGCGWITWVPSNFVSRLDLAALRASEAIYRPEDVVGRGLLLQATERAHEFTEEIESELENILQPVLEPDRYQSCRARRPLL